ncbi:hypothetical protein [Dietzia sp. KRD202]|uniref:hypothetical protein n=1 Tax=Dietzia sp. KRD202 TaxID=2729732 RepID=UPI0019D226D6|nr:hypothetical protein [Dietzia sp. KRD202]
MGRARDGRGTLIVTLLAALVLAVVSVVHSPPTAGAASYSVYLDVPADNADGELAGGVSTGMTTDVTELRAALDVVRAARVAPERYSTLARQYWLAVGAENADIDLEQWEPARGLAANLDTVDKVYVNYLRLYNSHDGYWWAGMAGLAGMSFAAGFWDLDDVGGVLTVPGVHEGEMPRDVRLLATVGPTLRQPDVDWYLHRLLVMQRHIFTDMIPVHEAYAAGGLPAVEELAAGGAYDDYALESWRMLDEGSPDGLSEALLRMASREQNQIIADQWDATASGRGDVGRVLTYITTVGGAPDIPGARTLGQFRPLSVRAEAGGQPVVAHTPLPAFNWADRVPRWEYIEQDLVPAYRSLVRDRPDEAPRYLDVGFRPRAEQNRILVRLPEFAGQMTTGWAVVPGR